ncbi:MAG: LPS-assembly protein LptD [Acidobacteriota bacterium]
MNLLRTVGWLCLLWLGGAVSGFAQHIPTLPPLPPLPPSTPVVVVGPPGTPTTPQALPTAQASPPVQVRPGTAVQIDADEQRRVGDVLYADGYVVIEYDGARLQADHVMYDEKSGVARVEGNVIYDPQPNQRLTARRAEFNVRLKTGTFYDVTGYTDQTADGGLLSFTAARVERTGRDTYILYEAKLTSCCEDAVPLWTVTAREARIRVNDYASARGAAFRVKGVPVLPLPYVALPIDRRERKSGFLLPTLGNNTLQGRVIGVGYYQTLGDSADLTLQGDLYSARGIGFGATLRAALAEDSFVRFGTYTVADRLFGPPGVNQGGTLFFAKAINRFANGFVGVADVNYTSSFDFRAIFGNTFEDVFNPESKIILHVGRQTPTFGFRAVYENRTTRVNIPQGERDSTLVEFSIRKSPSLNFDWLPTRLGRFAGLTWYASGEASLAGMRRTETRTDTNLRTFTTPTFVQRLDAAPRLTALLPDLGGWSITPTIGVRATYYGATFDPETAFTPRPPLAFGLPSPPSVIPLGTRLGTLGDSLLRRFVDVALEVRPPAVGRTFYTPQGQPRFKHVIESAITYRRVAGIENFPRILRFDALDIFANTNEVEYSIVNRLLAPVREGAGQTRQAREVLSLTISQKYFFDPTFGGALVPGQRNQIAPLLTFSGFASGGTGRRFSPVNIKLRVMPQAPFAADLRLDFDPVQGGVRSFGFTGGLYRRRFQLSQTWYYSQPRRLSDGQPEPGTFTGSQSFTSLALGDPSRGLFGSAAVAYDFSRSPSPTTGRFQRKGLIFSSFSLGYAFRCAAVQVNYASVNLGVASAGRLTFTLALRGIGTFGTDASQNTGSRIRNL